MIKKYDNFVFFSAGPVGDHVLLLDVANHFYKATGIMSTLILKHPSVFLNDLYLPYKKTIKQIFFKGYRGLAEAALLVFRSVYQKNVYVLYFPIPLPTYLRAFVVFIRYFTRSRVIGMNLEASKSFPVSRGYSYYLGKHNTISMQAESFTVSANRFLAFLGYDEIKWVPRLEFIEDAAILQQFSVEKGNYLVMHLPASHFLRSLPEDRWNVIIKEVAAKLAPVKIIFTGAKGDREFIEKSTVGIDATVYQMALGLKAQELLTLYACAHAAVTVQTGNGLIINMLHVPTVTVNIKGTTMFDYSFNEKGTSLHSSKDCICNPFETQCNMVSYKGREYMACLFNLTNEEVIDAIVAKYHAY